MSYNLILGKKEVKRMKKWIMPIGLIVVICILVMNVAMPICLANENKIEIGGVLDKVSSDVLFPNTFDYYSLGYLHKGDEIRVVMTELRGSGDVGFNLVRTPIFAQSQEACDKLTSLSPCCKSPCSCSSAIFACLDLVFGTENSSPSRQGGKISNMGEEKILEIPSDGVHYLEVFALKERINYKGYIEVIKIEVK
jgi:hypothetical protein